MADNVQTTVDALAKIAARRGQSTTETSEIDASDLYTAVTKANDLVGKLEKGIATESDKRELTLTKYQLEYYKADKQFSAAMFESRSKNLRDQAKNATTILAARIRAEARYNEKVRTADTDVLSRVDRALAHPSGDIVVTAFADSIHDPSLLPQGIKKPKVSTDDPAYMETMKQLFDKLNLKNQAPIFVFERTKTGEVTRRIDYQATMNNINARKIVGETHSTIKRQLTYYNQAVDRRDQRELRVADETSKSEQALDAALAALESDPEKGKQLFESWQETEQLRSLAWRQQNNVGDVSVLETRAQEARQRKNSLEKAIEWRDFLQEKAMGDAGGAKATREGIAMGIANPGFRAWAADYGWDRLGRVSAGEDGAPDYSTYVEGGDDIAALLAWKKQSLRRAGNYGLKRIATGEVLRVEMRDGTVVTGSRLRRHAADPMGSFRIVTPEGARVILPDEVSQAIYLQRPAPDLTRIDHRAMRIHEREKGKYIALERAALDLGDQEDLADLVQVGDGQYLVDGEGNYITHDALAEAQRNRQLTTEYNLYLKEGVNRLITPDGKVYDLSPDSALTEVDADAAQDWLAGLSRDDLRPAYMKNEDDSFRLFSAEDMQQAVKSGALTGVKFPSLDDSDEDRVAMSAAREANTSHESMDLKPGPRPTGFHGVPLGAGEGSTGVFFRPLGEGEEYELPEDFDADDPDVLEAAKTAEIQKAVTETSGVDVLKDDEITTVPRIPSSGPVALAGAGGRRVADEEAAKKGWSLEAASQAADAAEAKADAVAAQKLQATLAEGEAEEGAKFWQRITAQGQPKEVASRVVDESAEDRPGTGQDKPKSNQKVPMENRRAALRDAFESGETGDDAVFGPGEPRWGEESPVEDKPKSAPAGGDTGPDGKVPKGQTPQRTGVYDPVDPPPDEDDEAEAAAAEAAAAEAEAAAKAAAKKKAAAAKKKNKNGQTQKQFRDENLLPAGVIQ